MQQLINELYEVIRDYRIDENDPTVIITPARITRWINQFEQKDRAFILSEIKGVFQKLYCSKQRAQNFLIKIIGRLQKHYNYPDISDFLMETVFLYLQENENKSQYVLLGMLREILQDEFDFDMDDCGTRTVKNYIYLDDILCTGNTLFFDIKDWVEETNEAGETYLSQLEEGTIRLRFLYIFVHSANYRKKLSQFDIQITDNFENYCTLARLRLVESGIDTKLEILLPTDVDQPDIVHEYREKIELQVREVCQQKNYKIPKAEFYRPHNQPHEEEFFTSLENRKKLEDIFLRKGIEILNAANVNIPNMRALGYSLPTHKNFGFGTLCVTWRNVPNNCPIVFWYAGGGFFPLFEKNHTN